MLSSNPDIVCLDTAYTDFVHPLCEQLYLQGFEGQIISCTADFYDKIIERTSQEFVEGLVFQFPDFDDPALETQGVNFRNPNKFFEEYADRHPGEWGAVSWEYASIMDLWDRRRRKGRLGRTGRRSCRNERRRKGAPRLWRSRVVGDGTLRNRQRPWSVTGRLWSSKTARR